MSSPLTRSGLLQGARVAQYEVGGLIGHGATASVFAGMNVAIGRPVAIKILHEHLATDARASARFVREGKIAAQLRHPHAVDVVDVGAVGGLSYLVMELLEGRDLRAHLAETGPLSVAESLAVILPVASALAHAHGLGAVHRDLKPANIFLARDVRGDVRPKLVDFGLSKLDDDDGLTSSDLVMGTAGYMAPEQTLGSKHAGARSDQYSLAAVLYECVTGHAPVEAESFYALIEAIRAGVIVPPSTRVAGVPRAFDAVVLQALGRNPETRFPTVRAFARALLPFADDDTRAVLERDFVEPAAPPPGAPSSSRLASSRNVKAAALAPPESVGAPGDPTAPELRPLPCPAGSSPFRIKGMPYRGLLHLIERAIPGGLDAFCAQLEDESLRAFLRQPFLATARYDVLPFVPLSAALARLLGQPFTAFVRAASVAQARYDARTVFKRLYDGATRADVPARISRFESQYTSYAKFEAWFDGPDVLILQNTGVPAYLVPWYAPMHVGYTEEALTLIGTSGAATELPSVPAGTRHGLPVVRSRCELRWR